MSEYFRILKRIEGNQPDAATRSSKPAAGPRRRSQPAESPASPVRHEPAQPTVELPAGSAAAFAGLFDKIRALAGTNPVRTLVFAGASAREPVRAVINGLSAHAESRGLTVSTAQISHWGGRPILQSRSRDVPDSTEDDTAVMPLDLDGSAAPVELTDWLQDVERVADLVLIEGQSFDHSIDAALLARTCDGLVIVASTEVTARDALTSAADKAKSVGCRTFGLVLRSGPDRMPRWLRRLVPGPRR
jgi:hypothetical protein